MTQLRCVPITHSTHTNNSYENLRGATRVSRAREEAPEAADGERTDSRHRQLKNDAKEYRADGRDRGKEAAGARDALPGECNADSKLLKNKQQKSFLVTGETSKK